MQKVLLCIVLLLLVLSLCLAACSDNNENAITRLTIATGSPSGVYYPYAGAMQKVIEANHDNIKIVINATGASAENIHLIAAGHAQLAIVQNDVMDYAYHATNTWTEEAVTGFMTLMTLYPESCQLIVPADSDIYSVEDLEGKRVSTGAIGSGVEANATQILEAYGLSVSDITQRNLSFSASAEAMKDRTLDAAFITSSTPNTAITDLQTVRGLRFISLDDDKIDALIAAYPFYTKVTLTDADYSFISEPANTVAVRATLICTPSLSDDVAYNIVKTIIENKDTIAHANAAFININDAVQGTSIDFHPGALKYFQEQGVL